MPIKVGLTGGIGSGKTVVASIWQVMGIPVLNADDIAKQLINTDSDVRTQVADLLGEDVYDEHGLDRKKVAAAVFADKALLQGLNAIVHPATIAYIDKQMNEYAASEIIVKEAAIMIESGSHKSLDYMVGVDAPLSLRIARTMHRDQVTEDEVLRRMNAQMDQEEKMKLCDFVIINDDKQSLIEQCVSVIDIIKKKYNLT